MANTNVPLEGKRTVILVGNGKTLFLAVPPIGWKA